MEKKSNEKNSIFITKILKMKISEFKKMIKNYISEDEDVIGLNDGNTTEDFDDIGDGEGIDEAKKKKDTEEEITVDDITDKIPTEDIPSKDTETTVNISTDQVNPNIKAVQDALTQAQAVARTLGDDKLTDQIGNTITFFTRTHIVGGEQKDASLEEIELYEMRRMQKIAGIIK